jgi:1,5-anhydro-D-fructose reductase (1,5-anhydro-D-mannitol-forming)
MEKCVRWAFIGASIWARTRMIPAVQAVERSAAVGVFSTSRERGEAFREQAGLERAYASVGELLSDPDVDAVYISTRNDLHAEQTIAAASAGKHVLCEKPLSVSVEDGMRMVNACAEAGVALGTNHHLRGTATIRTMRGLLANGAIGELIAARVFHASLLPESMRTWRLDRKDSGAGVILDLTVHDVDTIRFLLDDDIVEVMAMTANQGMATEPVEDSVMGALRMRAGQLVCFHDAFTVPQAGSGIELHGSDGSLIGRDVMSADPVGEVLLRRSGIIEEIEIPDRWPLYEHAIRCFNRAVRKEGEPLTSGQDGLAAVAVAVAAAASARTGRVVVPESV